MNTTIGPGTNMSFILIIGLIIAVALFAGLIALLSRTGTGGRIAAICLAVVMMVAVFGGLFMFSLTPRFEPAVGNTPAPPQYLAPPPNVEVWPGQLVPPEVVRDSLAEHVAEHVDAAPPMATDSASSNQHSHSGSHSDAFPAEVTTVHYATSWNSIGLLVGLAIVVLIIAMVSKSSSAGWIMAAFVGLIMVGGFLVVAVFTYRSVGRETISMNRFDSRSSHPYLYGTESLPDIQSRLDQVGQSNELWTDAANDTLSAETYASLKQLGRGVGSQIVDAIKAAKHPPHVIHVQIKRESASGVDISDAISGCVERLKSEFPETDINANYSGKGSIKFSGSGTPGYGATVDLALQHVTRQRAAWDSSAHAAQYKIRTTLNHDNDQFRFEAELFEKPWVDDLGSYLVSRPNYMLIRARSSELENQPSRARRQAERAAAAEIVPQLESFFTSRFPHLGTNESELREQLESAIINEELFVIDRFPQAVTSRNQRMWREAILLNVDTDGLDHVASLIAQSREVRNSRRVSLEIGMAVLFILIFALGFVLNSLTKGYYQNRIGIGIGVGVIILCFLMIA